jgi:hypothetical protein
VPLAAPTVKAVAALPLRPPSGVVGGTSLQHFAVQ